MIIDSNFLLKNVKLNYPQAKSWMWNYCIYLGGFVASDGSKYDLGIHINENGSISAAIVYGDNPGDYISGDLNIIDTGYYEIFEATRTRATILGFYSPI